MSFTAKIKADISQFDKNIDQAIDSTNKLERTVKQKLSNVGDSFINVGKKATLLSAALVGVGVKAFSMAASFEDAMGATDQVFKTSSEEIQNWAKSLSSEYGVAKKEALEYANLMGTMLKNIGNLTESEASKQSKKLVELAGDLTAMYGGTTSEAVTALTASLRGINVPIAKYGVGINEALVKAKAFEMGVASLTGELSIQARQAATLQLIWDQTADAQGQAAREASSASGAMRAFRTEVSNLSTELGEALLPIITPIISKLTDLLGSLRALSPEMQSTIVAVAGVTAAVGPLLLVIGQVLKTLPLIKAALVALTGPIGIVVAAIVAATALIIANWDELKEASSQAVESLKSDWDFMANHFKTVSSAIGKTLRGDFSGWWSDVRTTFDANIEYIKTKWSQFQQLLGIWSNQAAKVAGQAGMMLGAIGSIDTSKPVTEVKTFTETLNKLAEAQATIAAPAAISAPAAVAAFSPVITPTIDGQSLKEKLWEVTKGAMADMGDGIKVLTIDLSSMLSGALTDIFGAVSEAIMSGDNVMGALGSSLLGTLGGIMVQLGQMVLVTGEAIEAVKAALVTGLGIPAIAAGVALIAIGSLFKAGSRKLGSSMGGGGYSSAPSMANISPGYAPSDYRGAYQDDFVVTFKIGNDELVGTLNTAEQRRKRI